MVFDEDVCRFVGLDILLFVKEFREYLGNWEGFFRASFVDWLEINVFESEIRSWGDGI